METEKILMGQKELKRWHLMELVKGGEVCGGMRGQACGIWIFTGFPT